MNKQCPFCGSHDCAVNHIQASDFESFAVECRSCGARGPQSYEQKDEDALKAWNQRVNDL